MITKWSRHTFTKFYFKKTIIDNISRQKKHVFSVQKKNNKIIILRPFLQFSRFEFLKFCEFWYLPIIPDFTNFNVCFRRNHLRLQFIPYLKIFLNINLFSKIHQFQQILKLENQYLQLIWKKIYGVTSDGQGQPGLLLWPTWSHPQRQILRDLDESPLFTDDPAANESPWQSWRLGAGLSGSTRCPLGLGSPSWPKAQFLYFPKIFQYLILYNFYYLVHQKISFNEISCILQKIKSQSKSK